MALTTAVQALLRRSPLNCAKFFIIWVFNKLTTWSKPAIQHHSQEKEKHLDCTEICRCHGLFTSDNYLCKTNRTSVRLFQSSLERCFQHNRAVISRLTVETTLNSTSIRAVWFQNTFHPTTFYIYLVFGSEPKRKIRPAGPAVLHNITHE